MYNLSKTEVNRLLSCLDKIAPQFRLAIKLMILAGLRSCELRDLRATAWNAQLSTLTVTTAKGGRKRTLKIPYPLNDELSTATVARCAHNVYAPICPMNLDRYRDIRPTRNQIRDALRDAATAAKLPHTTPQDLRCTFACRLHEAGWTDTQISAAMGHRQPSSLTYYLLPGLPVLP